MFDGSQDAGAGPLPDIGSDFGDEKKSFFQKIFSKSETAIPIILIVVLLLILVLAFSGWDYSSIPLVGGALQSIFGAKQYQVLIIGQPNPGVTDYILANPDFQKTYRFSQVSEEALDRNPESRLKPYDFIILDQSDSSTNLGLLKAIPYQLAEALKNYVASGNSLIIVGNSAHRVSGNADLYGWKAIFGDIVPADCLQTISLESPCETPVPLTGILQNTGVNTSLFEGIDEIPALSDRLSGKPGLNLTVYPVNHNGEEWFAVNDIRSGRTFSGIVVNKSMLGGKVIYISYPEWGQTPGVIQRLFEYAR